MPKPGRKRLLRLVALLVTLAMGAAACGSDDDGSAAGSGSSTGEPTTGGTLRLGVLLEPVFDPNDSAPGALAFVRNFYDSLIEVNPEREVLPALATDWKVADDNLSIELTLRDDVEFWSGTKLTAETLLPSIEKNKDPVLGRNTFTALTSLTKYEAVDDTTLKLSFDQPMRDEAIYDILSMIYAIDPTATGEGGLDKGPAGTGPFMMAEYKPGESVRLERNPNYWRDGEPAVDEVEVSIIADPDSAVSLLEAGEFDLMWGVNAKQTRRVTDAGFEVVRSPVDPYQLSLRLNTARPPFDNKFVRQAMNYVVDRATIVSSTYAGSTAPIVLPWSPGSLGDDPSYVEEYSYDLEKARELLDRSGLSDEELSGWKVMVSTSPIHEDTRQFAQMLQESLREIGVDIELDLTELSALVPRLQSSDMDATILQGSGGHKFPTRITQYPSFAITDNPLWGMSDPPTAFVDAVNRVNDPAEDLDSALADLREVIVDEAWMIHAATLPLGWTAVGDRVGGGAIVDSDNYLQLRQMFLAD